MAQDLWKALAFLYPNAVNRVDYEIWAVGEGDPWIAVWNLPQPQPTEAEIEAAILAYDARETQEAQGQTSLRQRIRTTAQSAVGVSVDALTGAQVRALLVILLHKEGALDNTGVVRPLSEWAK